jgi:hypothetical protein
MLQIISNLFKIRKNYLNNIMKSQILIQILIEKMFSMMLKYNQKMKHKVYLINFLNNRYLGKNLIISKEDSKKIKYYKNKEKSIL